VEPAFHQKKKMVVLKKKSGMGSTNSVAQVDVKEMLRRGLGKGEESARKQSVAFGQKGGLGSKQSLGRKKGGTNALP